MFSVCFEIYVKLLLFKIVHYSTTMTLTADIITIIHQFSEPVLPNRME